jgi:hypothetical protein
MVESEDLGVLAAVEATVPHLRHARIDEAQLANVCAKFGADDLQLPTWDEPVFFPRGTDARAAQILLFNAVNFCYWGAPKWELTYRGQWLGGSLAMLGAIRRAVESDGVALFDGAVLARLSETTLRHILRGRGDLQLIPERLAILHEVGAALERHFGGRLTNAIAEANGDAVALAQFLVTRFPSFDDQRMLDGVRIPFYKRAQLAAAMLYGAFGGQGWGALAHTDRLTVFADYKLPQVLRRLGILVYDDALAATVDGLELIPAGDRREVEIRVATVWAAELMRRALTKRIPGVTSLHLDNWLWRAGRYQGPDVQPYHRTVTSDY